jgi:hypothetical protein
VRRATWMAGFAAAGLALALPSDSRTQQQRPGLRPTLEPIAETRLLMDGLARANFRGLTRSLKERPADADAWTVTRGQALLLAETGNLLMLRPPRNDGQAEWMERAEGLRTSAARLARLAGQKNYEGCRNGLAEVAAACNRCHRSFRVAERVTPADE